MTREEVALSRTAPLTEPSGLSSCLPLLKPWVSGRKATCTRYHATRVRDLHCVWRPEAVAVKSAWEQRHRMDWSNSVFLDLVRRAAVDEGQHEGTAVPVVHSRRWRVNISAVWLVTLCTDCSICTNLLADNIGAAGRRRAAPALLQGAESSLLGGGEDGRCGRPEIRKKVKVTINVSSFLFESMIELQVSITQYSAD